MNAEQYVADWPDKLVEILESDIRLAQEINDRSWSIFTYNSRPAFGVSKNTVLYFSPDLDNVYLRINPSESSEATRNWLSGSGYTFEPDQQHLELKIAHQQINGIPDHLIEAHHAFIKPLAKYRNNRWKSFREDFHSAFSERLGRLLPRPGYYDRLVQLGEQEATRKAPEEKSSTKAEPTGYWLTTSNPNNATEARDYTRSLEEGRIVHRYGDSSIDFSQYPSDRSQFVRQAVNLDGIAHRAGNRLWLFAYGVQEGEWIVLQSTYPAIGQFTGEYQHTEDGDFRTVDWHWVSPNPIDSKTFYTALNGRNLWGFTTLEPIEFKPVLSALGQELLVDMSHVTEPPPPAHDQWESDFRGSVSDISVNFAASGLNYTDTQIADFYTALQTKGFVVLSGISGTGKSKIAQGFTRLLPDASITEIAGPDPVTAHEALQFRVSNYETWAAVSSDQSHLFPRTNQNIRFEVNFIFEGGIYRGSYKTRTLNFGKPTLYLILGKALTQRLRRAAGEETVYAQFRAAPNDESLPQNRAFARKVHT